MLETCDLAIANGQVFQWRDKGGDLRPATVLIDGERIRAIVPPDIPYFARSVIDARNMVVLPGLVNAHTHVAAALYRGVLDDWSGPGSSLYTVGFPAAAALTADEYYWLAMLGVIECLKAGATTINDLYHHSLVLARVVDEIGIRAVISQKIVSVDLTRIATAGYARRRDIAEERLNQNLELIETWHGKRHGRITCRFGPTTIDMTGEELLSRIREHATRLKVGIHIHLAESAEELAYVRSTHGRTPVEFLRDIDFLGSDVIAAHLTYATESDLEILAATKTAYAHAPPRYALGGYFPPLVGALQRGIRTGLGTDWIRMDMWEAFRQCVSGARLANRDGALLSAEEVLAMGTDRAAAALNIDGEVGRVAPGYLADLTIVNVNRPHLQPFYGRISALVYGADRADVDTVIVNGRVVVSSGRVVTVDEDTVLEAVRRLQPDLERRLRSFGGLRSTSATGARVD